MNSPMVGCPDTLHRGGSGPCSLVGLHFIKETGIHHDLRAFRYQPVAGWLSLGALDCLGKITFSLLIMSSFQNMFLRSRQFV